MLSFPWVKLANKNLLRWRYEKLYRSLAEPCLPPLAERNQGVSLIESLLVVVVVAAIVALMANLPNAMTLVSKSRHLSLAREIAVKQIEDKRAISYINLVNDTQPISDAAITLLPNGSGVVKVEDCNISVCTNAEPVKQITVNISWKEGNKEGKVELKTFIGKGGINQ